jgi:hypothetical protein
MKMAEWPRMSRYLDRARRYHESIRTILLKEWDPIGVADVPEAQDEYDSYVGQIYGMLIRHEARQTLVDHLWRVETEHMGLAGNRRHTEAVADRLLLLRDDMEAGGH